jgi:CheY-like chemotaxis protein
MPGMDGYELMGHLREMNICSSPVVMACSADWGSETEGKCHDVGFDGLLRKPITVTYLKDFLSKTKINL